MRGHALDSMASDSYLLKAPCPLHPCQCRLSKARPSASCGVVVALVLLLGAVLALAAVTYCQQVELLVVRDELHAIRDQLKRIDLLNALKTFEADASPAMDHGAGSEEDDDEDDDDDDDDDNGPFYDDVEGTNVVEGKARGSEDDSAPFVRLEPASGHVTSTTPAPITVDRRRRQVRQVAGRPQPQLKLYHMLQTPGTGTGLSAVAPPAEPWSQHGARQPQGYPYGRPQPMYAEHAPMAYAAPPPRYGTSVGASSTAAPIASRRSRVMDAVAGTPSSLVQQQQQHRRRHQHRLQQQQHLYQQRQQLQNLQDVTQEVPQGGRSAEVGRRWQQQQQLQQQQLQQQRWPSSTPRPSSWSATERPAGAGRWREQDPWQDRVRTTRVTDQHRP